MTAVLVLLTFVVFLTIDYLRHKKLAAQLEVAAERKLLSLPVSPGAGPAIVAGFEVRNNLRYHPGHAWALGESPNLVRVGLDDFATRLIGSIGAISLPRRGQWIRQGQQLATVLKNGSRAVLFSPIEGEVRGVNEAVLADPALLTREPYGEGWLITVHAPDAGTNFRNLLRGNLARKWMELDAARLRKRMGAAPVFAQDGGRAIDNVGDRFGGDAWEKLTREFFLG